MRKTLRVTVTAESLSLADVHLALTRVNILLARDVIHTMPPTELHHVVQGVDVRLEVEHAVRVPETRVQVRRAQLEGVRASCARLERFLNRPAVGPRDLDTTREDLGVVVAQLDHMLKEKS